MNEKDLEILFKMNQLCKQLVHDFKDVNRHEFFKPNSIIRKALSFDLIQIGELANTVNAKLSKEQKEEKSQYLSSDFLAKYRGSKGFGWYGAYRLRCELAHGTAVSSRLLWGLCQDKIPLLLRYTNKILEEVRRQEEAKKEEAKKEQAKGKQTKKEQPKKENLKKENPKKEQTKAPPSKEGSLEAKMAGVIKRRADMKQQTQNQNAQSHNTQLPTKATKPKGIDI